MFQTRKRQLFIALDKSALRTCVPEQVESPQGVFRRFAMHGRLARSELRNLLRHLSLELGRTCNSPAASWRRVRWTAVCQTPFRSEGVYST